MKVPRTVVTRHPMGRPLGAPGDASRRRQVLQAAPRLREEAREGSTIVDRPEPYRVPGMTP